MTKSEQQLMAALERRYKPPEWALFAQVANGTGYRQSRYCDALAMNLYPSRGLELNGFEFKASRGDFLSEIREPEKSEPVQKFCHRWWVLTETDVVHDVGEVPVTWGWIERKGARLYTKKPAPELTPLPPDHAFLAAVLRRSRNGMVTEASVKPAIDAAYEDGRQQAEKLAEINSGQDHAKNLEERITKFEAESGIKLDTWNAGNIGKAVESVLELQRTLGGWHLEQAERALRDAADLMKKFKEDEPWKP